MPRQAPCRGRCLVASGSLSLTGPCRDAWRVAASSLRCLGWPSRQAPLAGALSPWLEYFVLEWLQRNHGGPWRSPSKPCRGVLQLPVHKFGILGYPYSSTPTHSHSEIYCHATFHRSIYYDMLHHCHIALHDHVVDIVFVAKPPFIILSYMSLMHHCISWYTARGIHIESSLF